METFKQYAEVQKQIDLLEEKKEVLRKEIAVFLPETGDNNEFCNSFWTLKKKWKYSQKVDALKTELDSTKTLEEENGTAISEETKQLTIKVK